MSATDPSILCVELAQTYAREEDVLREAQAIFEFVRQRKAADPRSRFGAAIFPEPY